jgi:hypothetical protein
VSVVEDKLKISELVVRARNKTILEKIFPENEILELDISDYKYRTYCTKNEWSKIVVDRINNIDYTNFKASVVDKDLHDMYNNFWYIHYKYQM